MPCCIASLLPTPWFSAPSVQPKAWSTWLLRPQPSQMGGCGGQVATPAATPSETWVRAAAAACSPAALHSDLGQRVPPTPPHVEWGEENLILDPIPNSSVFLFTRFQDLDLDLFFTLIVVVPSSLAYSLVSRQQFKECLLLF